MIDPWGRLLSAAQAQSALAVSQVGVIVPVAHEAEAGRTLDEIERNPHGHRRWLVFGWIGTHPDARVPVLRRSWDLEERCRASGLPTLVLRCAPLVGARSPFWLRLAHSGAGRDAGRPLQPVLEADVVTLVKRIAAGRVADVPAESVA